MADVSFLLSGRLLSLRWPPLPTHVCLLPSLGRRLVMAQRQPTVLLHLGSDEGAVAQPPLLYFLSLSPWAQINERDHHGRSLKGAPIGC
jgi:hypothetical protein